MEDEEILELYWERDEQAVTMTANKYGHHLHRLSKSIVKNNEDAEECVNDTYQKAWENIPPTRPVYFLAYLAKITRHFSFGKLDYHLAAKRNVELVTLSRELEDCISASADENTHIDSWEIGERISSFLQMQKEIHRQIFIRRYFGTDSVKSIAKSYGISESKVKSILFRMRKSLKKHLEQGGIWV